MLGVFRRLPYIKDMTQTIDRRSLILRATATLAALAPVSVLAQEEVAEDAALPAYGPVPASEISEAELLYLRRPVIVFADSPADPNFIRQMEILPAVYAQLQLRDVILVTDTDPANPTDLRKKWRPRGFSLVVMDKDWRSPIRKPLPWAGREIVNAIDRMPIARTEALERNPAGR